MMAIVCRFLQQHFVAEVGLKDIGGWRKGGDYARFDLDKSQPQNDFVSIELHTKDCADAGTDDDIQFRLKYKNGAECTYRAEDYSRNRAVSFEKNETDHFKVPLIPNEALKSITVEVRKDGGTAWAPDWIKVGDRSSFYFRYASEHNKGLIDGDIWWAQEAGDSATFNF